MKKFAIIPAVLLAFLLTACNNGGSGSESTSGSTSTSSANVSSSSSSTSSSVSDSKADEKKADYYAETVLKAVEFPKMTKVETAEEIDAIFEFNTANYADYALYMNVMSVQLNRVLIVKPLPEKHDEVEAELKAYLEDLTENNAFYPAQESAAAGAVMGETADGYIYVIVHEDGITAVRAIENAAG